MDHIFQTVTDSYASQFESLGLHLVDRADLWIVFSDGRHLIEIERDHLNPLSISITVGDADGGRRPIFLLENALSPEFATNYRQSKAELLKTLALKSKTIGDLLEDPNRYTYLDYAIGMAFKFIAAHFHEIFDMTPDARAKYEIAAEAAAKKWGLPNLSN